MNIHVPPDAAAPPAAIFTRRLLTTADIFKMIDSGIIKPDERFELIEGEMILMGPNLSDHEWIKSLVNQELVRAMPKSMFIGVEASVYLNKRTFVNPDLFLYPRAILTEKLVPADVPLVIEVAATSLRYDTLIKSPLYARFGFPEYWLINAHTKVTTIHRQPVDGQWTETVTVGPDEALTFDLLPTFSIVFNEES
jgi:Uma2 family endonuclease